MARLSALHKASPFCSRGMLRRRRRARGPRLHPSPYRAASNLAARRQVSALKGLGKVLESAALVYLAADRVAQISFQGLGGLEYVVDVTRARDTSGDRYAAAKR
jgi:hypothetical protein